MSDNRNQDRSRVVLTLTVIVEVCSAILFVLPFITNKKNNNNRKDK